MAVRTVRTPAVFICSEADAIDRTCEVAVAFSFIIGKLDLHTVSAFRVLIHKHHGPLAVRAFYYVRGHEQISKWVARIARRSKNSVHRVNRLHPFLSN
jgi:hypothetical protein